MIMLSALHGLLSRQTFDNNPSLGLRGMFSFVLLRLYCWHMATSMATCKPVANHEVRCRSGKQKGRLSQLTKAQQLLVYLLSKMHHSTAPWVLMRPVPDQRLPASSQATLTDLSTVLQLIRTPSSHKQHRKPSQVQLHRAAGRQLSQGLLSIRRFNRTALQQLS